MVRHIVLVQFKPGLAAAEIEGVFAALAALRSVLPGMTAFHAGPNVSPEGMNRSFGHGFVADFADTAARDAYLEHPAHKAAGGRLVAAAAGGRDGLLVIDLEQ